MKTSRPSMMRRIVALLNGAAVASGETNAAVQARARVEQHAAAHDEIGEESVDVTDRAAAQHAVSHRPAVDLGLPLGLSANT